MIIPTKTFYFLLLYLFLEVTYLSSFAPDLKFGSVIIISSCARCSIFIKQQQQIYFDFLFFLLLLQK